jgi:hypothetical protein
VNVFDDKVASKKLWFHIGRANRAYELSDDNYEKLILCVSNPEYIKNCVDTFIDRFKSKINDNIDPNKYKVWIEETMLALCENEYWFEISSKFTCNINISPKARYNNVKNKLDNKKLLLN